jgi:hypothetical protein
MIDIAHDEDFAAINQQLCLYYLIIKLFVFIDTSFHFHFMTFTTVNSLKHKNDVIYIRHEVVKDILFQFNFHDVEMELYIYSALLIYEFSIASHAFDHDITTVLLVILDHHSH